MQQLGELYNLSGSNPSSLPEAVGFSPGSLTSPSPFQTTSLYGEETVLICGAGGRMYQGVPVGFLSPQSKRKKIHQLHTMYHSTDRLFLASEHSLILSEEPGEPLH